MTNLEPKFKVGDKVTVVDNPHPEEDYFGIFKDIVRARAGEIYEVEAVAPDEKFNTYTLNDEGFFWPEYLLASANV